MPPKAEAPPKLTKKQQEALRQEMAMKQAADDAARLFKHHDKERRNAEIADKATRDMEIFGKALEDERLATERAAFQGVNRELAEKQKRTIVEHERQVGWNTLMEVSWLPNVAVEAEINAFISTWKEEQEEEFPAVGQETKVVMKCTGAPRSVIVEQMLLLRADTGPSNTVRHKRIDGDLGMCVMAVQLAENIWRAADIAAVRKDSALVAFHRRNLINVYNRILDCIDTLTINVGQYVDIFIQREEDHLVRAVPKERPCIKYGLWTKASQQGQARGTVSHVRYPDIGISIDPKDSQTVRLPRALNLSRDNMAIRAVQLSFDPYSVNSPANVGQDYYALDCIIIIESMQLPERVKKQGEWASRMETPMARVLNKQEYPPKNPDQKTDDFTVKITFEVPDNIVVRHRSPLIGKWNEQAKKWDPCGTSNFVFESVVRKTSFLTNDLTAMAVIQEKGFDVPYEQWQLYPIGEDQVLYIIEGRRRGEASDREIKILVRDSLCKLVAPEEKELLYLRNNWLQPATLLRMLARIGYNFLLQDPDVEFIPNVLQPKTAVMEAKGYSDIALFCTMHAFASTRHNKLGEDPNMTLFRISKDVRELDSEEPFARDVDEDDKWHSVRYEKERCAFARFKDSHDEPDLSDLEGHATHLNLFMLLKSVYGEDNVGHRAQSSNHLLQQAVCQLLQLTRPFTWG